MRQSALFVAMFLAVPAGALAAVVELDSAAMVGTYVQGISIGQEVTDKPFASDDQQQRDAATELQNAQGEPVGPSIAVTNGDALDKQQQPDLKTLVPQTLAGIKDSNVRDLTEDALVQTQIVRTDPLSNQVNFNYAKLAEFGVGNGSPGTAPADLNALRGTLLDLLPSTTGYQLELLKGR